MVRSRAYRSRKIKQVDWEQMFASHAGEECWVGLDISKDEVVGVVRWRDGHWERPWRAANPGEIGALAETLGAVGRARPLVVAMESSGTYGDALRQALADQKVEVHRVSTKRTHDYAEVFDGVPSQHDGKDAAVVAELACLGKSSPWLYEAASEADQEMAYWVDWMDAHRRQRAMWCGRLEGLIARHWPEATAHLGLGTATLPAALAHYGGPAPLAADPEAALRLRRWGGPFLKAQTIAAVIGSASATVGVRQTDADLYRLSSCAAQVRAADGQLRQARRALAPLAAGNPVIQAQAAVVGMATACVLWVHLGPPGDYPCGAAYRKAMGLNLKERSSGRWKGSLKITKRGAAQVRRWLYFAALRWCRHPQVQPWYAAKKQKDGAARGALVAIMRKLAPALHQVGARGVDFDVKRLSPGPKRCRRGVPNA